jgi:hypothetical protein
VSFVGSGSGTSSPAVVTIPSGVFAGTAGISVVSAPRSPTCEHG